jgi:hypothetical protein
MLLVTTPTAAKKVYLHLIAVPFMGRVTNFPYPALAESSNFG